MPTPGGRYFGGEYTRSRVPRRGVFAAVDVRTNRLAMAAAVGRDVLRGLDGDGAAGCSSSAATTAA